MKRKKGVLLLLLLSLLLPSVSAAQEQSVDVGIGFSEGQTLRQPYPSVTTPINNVLPATSTMRASESPISRGSLPKTGEVQDRRLQIAGIVCLVACYWLFLVARFKKEEQYE